ncbi:hypothetical protein RhiirA4_476320 [Rhizophagus irregularis]|uniref:Uncharacterized protein n=1 Tax=Rhizophagus irregularis TaxID=588596 RepID=A0A2I1HBE2_9GLOM|nr:hypothetical protein RhiirA4_476320 [Rhizophagus irregularis]
MSLQDPTLTPKQQPLILIPCNDGSVKQIGTRQCTSRYGWIQTHPSTPKLSFKGSNGNWINNQIKEAIEQGKVFTELMRIINNGRKYYYK